MWQGMPMNSTPTRAELATRVDACTGIRQKFTDRKVAHQRNLKAIVDVIRIPESSLMSHMNWATWHFQDIALTI